MTLGMDMDRADDRAPLLCPDPSPGGFDDATGPPHSECVPANKPDPPPTTKVYARRWYVLAIFCLLNVTQNIMWNTWGPVSDSASLVFGWTNAEIGLFATLGNVTYALSVFGAAYVMDVVGLRTASLGMAALMAAGAMMRCITSDQVILFWMSVASALLAGVGGTITFSGSALFSSVWFPASQRATATAIINTFNFLGVSVSFLLGPAIVKFVTPTIPIHNDTRMDISTYPSSAHPDFPHLFGEVVELGSFGNNSNNYTESLIDKQRDEIMIYLYVQAAIAGFVLLLVLTYFPSKPPLPPSISASTSRLKFREGIWSLATNRSFWFLTLAYSVPAGLFGIWGTVLNVNLGPIGVTQEQASLIGISYNLAGGLAGLGVSRFSDLLSGHMKQMLIGLYVLASGALCWLILINEQYIPYHLPSMYMSAILASVFINSGVALFYELSSEMCYPVAEGIIGGYLTFFNNIVGIIFLCLLYIPNIGTTWMNWTMFSGTLLAVPLLFFVKAKYHRLQIDTVDQQQSIQQEGADPNAIVDLL